MGSGILQLAAFGEQDKYLTGNPQMTYFKMVYRRHTNFAIEPLLLDVNTTIDFGSSNVNSNTIFTTIKKNGDLVGNIYLEVLVRGKGNEGQFTVNHFGNSFLKEVKIMIGDAVIDTHNSQWLQISRELYSSHTEKNETYREVSTGPKGGKNIPDVVPGIGFGNQYWSYDMNHIDVMSRTVGDCPLVFGGTKHLDGLKVGQASTGFAYDTYYRKKIYIPLQFWFNRYPGLALPLIALGNQDVKLAFKFESRDNLRGNLSNTETALKIESVNIYADYYYLDKTEKELFKTKAHEYLIEQVQTIQTQTEISLKNGSTTESNEINYFLNNLQHPVKYLTWVITNPGVNGSNKGQGPCYFVSLCSNSQHGNDGNDGSVILKFANVDRFPQRPMSYFTRLLPSKYCNGCMPDLDRIGLYSFAMNPFDIQPSGTLNFSKIQTDKMLRISTANINMSDIYFDDSNNEVKKDLFIFGVNYNILRIEGGYGGLLFI